MVIYLNGSLKRTMLHQNLKGWTSKLFMVQSMWNDPQIITGYLAIFNELPAWHRRKRARLQCMRSRGRFLVEAQNSGIDPVS